MGYIGVVGYILMLFRDTKKKMETTIMGYIGSIGDVLGLFGDNEKEDGNYHNGFHRHYRVFIGVILGSWT